MKYLLEAVLLGFAMGGLYVAQLVVYRFFFHPYAKYPGPFWAKISYFYAFYHAWMGTTTQAQMECYNRYGLVVRYTPDNILLNQPEARKDIYGAGKNFIKGKAYEPMNMQPGTWNIAFTPHKKEHGRRRRIIAQGFSDHAIKDSQIYIQEHINKLCKVLAARASQSGDKWSDPVDMEDPFFWLTMDQTTDLVFGESYNLLENTEYRNFASVIKETLRRFSLIFQYPAIFRPGIGKWMDFGTWMLPNMVNKLFFLLSVGAQTATKRIEAGKDGTTRKDVLSYLIKGVDPETGTTFEAQDIIVEAMVLLQAGGDTTSLAMRVLFFYLTRNPAAMAKVTTEIRSAFSSPDEIALGPVMDSCTYLHACIDETLRLFSGAAFWRDAGPGGAPITISPNHQADADSLFIPEGLTVGVNQSAISHRPDIYPDPYAFKPERWIVDDTTGITSDMVKTARHAWAPFSSGPRGCIAKSLAQAIMVLTTSALLWRFDFKLPDTVERGRERGERRVWGHPELTEYDLKGSFTMAAGGPVVQLRQRVEVKA